MPFLKKLLEDNMRNVKTTKIWKYFEKDMLRVITWKILEGKNNELS